MSYSFGKFDNTSSFYAENLSKLGKKEIQIFPVQKEVDSLAVAESLVVSFDIDENQEVVGFEWIYVTSSFSNGKSKRRKSSSNEIPASQKQTPYLVVAFKNGEVLILSPLQKHIINEISTGFEIISLTSAFDSFWIAGPNESREYVLNDVKPKNTISYPKNIGSVSSIHAFQFKTHKLLALGGNKKLSLIDTSSNNVFKEYASKSQITHITSNDQHILTADSNTISTFSLDSSKLLVSLNSSEPILSLFIIKNVAGAVTTDGNIQLFESALTSGSSEISSIISPSTDQVKFSTATTYESNLLVAWDDLTPKFKLVDMDNLPAQLEVDVGYSGKNRLDSKPSTKPVLEPVVFDLEPTDDYNVREIELYQLVENNISDPSTLLEVLISNNDQDKMKYVTAEIGEISALKLYNVLSLRVQANPTESSVLNTWLKWLIISHNKTINESENFKPLRLSIKKELKQLPNLLSLQGRLELLKSQLQLRSELSSVLNQETEIPSDLVSKAEEKIVYINGENDDGYDVIEEAGNSESEPEDDEDTRVNGVAEIAEENSDIAVDGEIPQDQL